MRTLRYGIEIETVGQTRRIIARAIQRVVGGIVRHPGRYDGYDTWKIVDSCGRTWKVMADSSLNASYEFQAEIVSPILRYDDIQQLQEVVRAVRRAGAKVDDSTGIHIHIDGARFDVPAVCRLVKIINKQERLIENALGINDRRLSQYCRSIDQGFLARIERSRPRTLEDLNRLWYGYHNDRPVHYDQTRYHGLNLHNVFYRGTVEFRWFESTLHAGKVKGYIQFVLALAAKALKARGASSKKRHFNPASAKYDFRVFLLGLGLIGDEFKTARKHLLARLPGSAAWKNGRPNRAGQTSTEPEIVLGATAA